ncbi:MAG: hypothetical protein SO160_08145 [Lachnospiraceae bacterium]|nr:hypothetical protein [Lachnospiraceae bacterium]
MFENNIVINYLEKYSDLLLEEKINLQAQQKNIEQEIKETVAFRKLLEEKNDSSFEIFTPHIVNSKNKEEIKKLEQQEEKKKLELQEILEQIEQQEEKYEELAVVIKQAKQDYANHQEKSSLQNSLDEIVYKRLEQFITKIDLCSNLLNLDSMRCKIELDNMKKSVLDMQHELQKVFQPYNTIKNNDARKK